MSMMVDTIEMGSVSTETMPLTVIVNGNSGTSEGSEGEDAGALRALFRAHGCQATVEIVGEGDDVTSIARRAIEGGARIVVAGGGDGTVRAVAAAVAGTDAALGVLPLGTLNHFAKDLAIPLDLEEAVGTIAEGHSTAIDIAEVNGVMFINNSSLGLYPRMVRMREAWQEEHELGKWSAFTLAVSQAFRRYRLLDLLLEVDGRPVRVRTPFVFVGNNEYMLDGLDIGTRERLSGGELCIFVARHAGRLRLFGLLFHALLGRLRNAEDFEAFMARRVRVRSARRTLEVATDGEVQMLEAPLEYAIHAGALRVIVPRDPLTL